MSVSRNYRLGLIKLLGTAQPLSTVHDHIDLSYFVLKHIQYKFIEDGQLVAYSGSFHRSQDYVTGSMLFIPVNFTFNISEDLKSGDLSVHPRLLDSHSIYK